MAYLFGRHWTREQLRQRVGDMAQIAGIRLAELSDGRGRGVRVADCDTGSGLRFTVLLDRALDIGPMSLDGRAIAWQSSAGVTHPAYYQPEGLEWLWGFHGGMLCLCGLAAAGAPAKEDAWGGHGLHGRISNTPAYQVNTGNGWAGDEYELWIEGKVRETSVFGVDLILTRRITFRAGESRISVTDSIENAGYLPAPLVLLYHCNFGFPLVDAGSRIFVDDIACQARDAVAEAGLGRERDLEAPQAGYAEQCFFHDVRPDAAGFCRAGVINDSLDGGQGMAAYVRWRKEELPLLLEWKQMGAGTYVVGLEPGNLRPEGRQRAYETGRLRLLAPGEIVHLALEFGALRGKEAIGRLS